MISPKVHELKHHFLHFEFLFLSSVLCFLLKVHMHITAAPPFYSKLFIYSFEARGLFTFY